MLVRKLILVSLAMILLIVGCGTPKPAKPGIPEPSRAPQPRNTLEASIVPSETPTPTPVGDIGWRKITGVVYAEAEAPGNELSGALVRCSHHSYTSPPESLCAPREITTGSDGAFEFDLFVHDTDGITISAEKVGFGSGEYRIGGFDCVGACPHVALVLEVNE
jgi:hypothetical protein